ncbi:hypothetical protein CPC08DRAFT_704668 [Agrocybe pediades]|nr:hypothetical protein CPC08DRAFT_704668 [Agrocybe pediades]
MPRSTVAVENITPGMVVYAAPGNLIVEDVLTTQTLTRQRRDKHPLIVLSVNAGAQQIMVTYIATFLNSNSLAEVALRGGDAARRLFVPVTPATREFDYEPITWLAHPDPIPAGWASARSKMVLTGAEFRTFDDAKYFSADTAAALDALITTVV